MNPRILLVEDDPTSRAYLQAATGSLPACVDAAATMAEALSLATAHPHALWLFDARLPDGSGSELLARLRGLGLATPAIAHTASRERGDHRALLAAGFVATLAKPIAAGAWQDAIRRILDTGNRTSPASGMAARRVEEPAAPVALPVWDDARALAALAGDARNVAALRGLFLAELPATRDAMVQAAAAGDLGTLRATLHRLEASCGFVGAGRLGAAVAQLRAAPASPEAMKQLRLAVQDTLSCA